jgi:hypothetical protein
MAICLVGAQPVKIKLANKLNFKEEVYLIDMH